MPGICHHDNRVYVLLIYHLHWTRLDFERWLNLPNNHPSHTVFYKAGGVFLLVLLVTVKVRLLTVNVRLVTVNVRLFTLNTLLFTVNVRLFAVNVRIEKTDIKVLYYFTTRTFEKRRSLLSYHLVGSYVVTVIITKTLFVEIQPDKIKYFIHCWIRH